MPERISQRDLTVNGWSTVSHTSILKREQPPSHTGTTQNTLEYFCKPDFAHFSQHCLSFVHPNSLLLHAAQSACAAKSPNTGLQKHSIDASSLSEASYLHLHEHVNMIINLFLLSSQSEQQKHSRWGRVQSNPPRQESLLKKRHYTVPYRTEHLSMKPSPSNADFCV